MVVPNFASSGNNLAANGSFIQNYQNLEISSQLSKQIGEELEKVFNKDSRQRKQVDNTSQMATINAAIQEAVAGLSVEISNLPNKLGTEIGNTVAPQLESAMNTFQAQQNQAANTPAAAGAAANQQFGTIMVKHQVEGNIQASADAFTKATMDAVQNALEDRIPGIGSDIAGHQGPQIT